MVERKALRPKLTMTNQNSISTFKKVVIPKVVGDKVLAPIDAQQLLNALAPLLSGDGSIKGPVEAVRISSLMKDAYKMVSKCVYLNILKITSDLPTLEKFISVGGWETLNNWLQECKAPEYDAFLIEVLKVYKELPVTIDILKKNNAAKTIKQLVKSDVESIKILSGNIVDQWMKTVREGKGDDGEKKKDKKRKKEHSSSKDKEKSRDSNSVTSEGQSKPDHKHEHSKHRHNSTEEKSSKRPKTVKTLPPKFRSTGLEDQTIVPVKKKPIPENKPLPVLPKRSVNSGEEPPEKKSRLTLTIPTPSLSSSSTNPTSSSPVNTSPPEVTHGKIKIIPAKRLPTHEIHEDSGFMDSLSRAPRPGVVKKKKKLTSPITTSAPTTTTTTTGPPQLKPAVSNISPTSSSPISPTASMAARLPSVPSFYKDTLETTEEAAPQESNERSPSPEINSANLQMPLLSPERPITPTDDDMDSNRTGEDADKSKENGGEGVDENGDQKSLLTSGQTKRKKPKKKLRWADENRLRQFFYFELDETERENVNRPKDFQSLKKAERMMEGRAMDSARRLSHDNQLETIPWRKPELLDNVVEVVVPGCNSADKETQRQREQGVLQALFFSKAMLPDTPTEPDLESFDVTEPKIIPLEDTTSSGEEYSYTYDNIESKPDKLTPDPPQQEMFHAPGSAGLPPELTNILNNFSKNPPVGNNVPNDMMQNVKNMLAVIMQASQDNNQNEMIDKLRLALEPFRHEVPELFQMQPNFGMGGPPNMMVGPGGPGGPRPGGPGSGLLGAAPPGFAPLAGQRPPPPMFMGPGGPGGPRGPGPIDEWGENMMGGPRGPMGPMRHGFPRPRGGPMNRGPMRGRGGNFGRGGRGGVGGGGNWDRNGDGGDRSMRGDHNDSRGRGRNDRKRTVCRHFVAGGCKYGDTCSFLHPGVNGPA